VSDDIDLSIEKKERELQPLRSGMEALKEEFIRETCLFAAEWFQKTAKQYIAKYPNIMLSLSQEQVARMKEKIDNLTRNAPETVGEVLENPLLWWHINPRSNDSIEQYAQVANKYPELLDRAVRQALGPLGLVLEEFKFHVSTNRNLGSFDEFWFAEAVGSKEIVPSYPHLLPWSDDMQDSIRHYNLAYIKALKLFHEIQLLRDEKKRLEALTRWDSA
jgi:hypothetical protein